ncbi:polysaccharide biosynthesis C-terminal domain-containing protein [Klebsiella variicola]|uniref:polysaccharide biosynthesis C-terminal domain-containing protein n=1 Tax=Klebsiella variicola TaxID=244366 RepID=UPI0024066C21|nr:polysaccharide biosynthesis C-terminal domain-containing protein [Klebsiella variicola]MDG0496710.1 polysaccharide biosynthesis C-terminal domain-containing protein [Klebsiella variicola]
MMKSVTAIATLSLISRSLSELNFGEYVTLVSLGGVFLALTNIGAESLIPKIISKKDSGSEFYLLKLTATFLFCMIFLIICFTYYKNISWQYILIFSISFFCYFYSYSEYVANQKGLISLFSKISISIQSISYYGGDNIVFWLCIFSVEYLLTGLISYLLLKEPVTFKGIDKSKLQLMMKDVSFILLSSATIAAYMRIDTLMISYYLGSDAAGKYFAGSRLSEGVYFIGISVANIFYSQTLRDNIAEKKTVSRDIKKYILFLFVLGVAGTSFINLFSNMAINFLYGKEFSVSAKILSIHSISIAFVFIGGYLSRLYIGCGYAKKNFRRTFFSLIINVALVYYMIPHFGISGAAYAMVISQIFSSFIMFIIDKEFMSRLAKGKI